DGAGAGLAAATLRSNGTRRVATAEREHNGAESVGISQRGGFAIGKLPELLQRRRVAGVRASGNRPIALRQVTEQPWHGSVRRREIGCDRDEMEICPRIDDRAA